MTEPENKSPNKAASALSLFGLNIYSCTEVSLGIESFQIRAREHVGFKACLVILSRGRLCRRCVVEVFTSFASISLMLTGS